MLHRYRQRIFRAYGFPDSGTTRSCDSFEGGEMQQISQRRYIRLALRGSLIALIVVLLGGASVWAYPKKSTSAPPLDSLKLLQAPLGARANWASLTGKVVVLEF